jgi:uncharacterized membrane protein
VEYKGREIGSIGQPIALARQQGAELHNQVGRGGQLAHNGAILDRAGAAMLSLIVGLAIFLGGHSVTIFAPDWRERMAAQFGINGWRIGYSLVSLLGLYLIIHGFAAARLTPVVLYVPASWMRILGQLLMVPVFPLLVATWFPGKIRSTLKHPMLAAIKTWAVAHLLANGMLADVLLFGGFLAWAVALRIALKHRTPRAVPSVPVTPVNDFFAVAIGFFLFVVTAFWAHQKLFGVSPLP